MHVVLLKRRLGKIGGLEKHTLRLAEGFRQKGCQVDIVTSASVNSISWPGFLAIEQFDRKSHAWIKEYKPDVVLGMERNRFQTHLRAGSGVHAAYLEQRCKLESRWKRVSFSINPLHRTILDIEKKGFENPELKKIFTNSHMVKREILQFYRVNPAIIEVIHNGVEWHEMEKDFGEWKPSPFIQLLFIGNGYQRKGLIPLLQALALVKNKDFHLSVIGKESKMNRYLSLVKELHLEKQVHFYGPQSNIRPFYQKADALIIPSYYDPFANVTVEALAMGLTVLSSPMNGGHEILPPENVIDIDNLESFAASLQKIKPKTIASAVQIRNSVQHLDFSRQVSQLINSCLC